MREQTHNLFILPEPEPLMVRLGREVRAACHEFREDPIGFVKLAFAAPESGTLLARLFRLWRGGWSEFWADPVGFLKYTFAQDEYGKKRRRVILLGSGLQLAALAGVILLSSLYRYLHPPEIPSSYGPEIAFVEPSSRVPLYAPTQKQRAGGGGGGGRKELRPASFGKLPKAELKPPIVAPSPHLPEIKQPELPVLPTIMAQQELLPKLSQLLPLGDPAAAGAVASSGSGTGGGIGTGKGGGVGPGEGVGYGPGRGWNTGGGDPRIGGGDGVVRSRPQITYKPRPEWTEEARRNRIQGKVVLSVTLAADGTVRDIRLVQGLGYGLDEKAIEAAKQVKFIPARDASGNPINWRGTITVEFNLL